MSEMHQKSTVLKFIRTVPSATTPSRATPKAAGYDLASAYDCVVPARKGFVIDTGLKIELPAGCYGRIAPRAGIAANNSIGVGAGVVDQDYRGLLKIVLFNHSDEDFHVKSGDRVAQLIFEKILDLELKEVKEEELSSTGRGESGFGSSGTK